MGKTFTVSKWRYWCPIRNKWLITRYKTTADRMAIEHPEATSVAGSEETREEPSSPLANSTSVFYRGFKG
jgi:hypothetical protein